MISRSIPWLPEDHAARRREMELFTDYQRGWYISLYDACATSEIPGYLKITEAQPLWKSAGAPTERCFARKQAAVVAAFRFAEKAGKKYLYHPRLLAVIVEQLPKMKRWRSTVSELSTSGEQLPLLLFSVLEGKKPLPGRTVSTSASSEALNERISKRFAELRGAGNGAR